MTNGEYAILVGDLTLITRVALKYIYTYIRPSSPLWEKERLYNEWCSLEYNEALW